jgi:hypothetical protein
MPDYYPGPHPLEPVVKQWLLKLQAARKRKWDEFGCYAKEAHDFYNSLHDFMWKGEYATSAATGGFLNAEVPLPSFRMTVNRVFEAVAIFGPVLYNRNPNVLVTPRQPPLPTPQALGIDPAWLDPNQTDPMMVMVAQQFQQLMAGEQTQAAQRAAQGAIIQHYLEWLQYECDKKTEAKLVIDEAIVKGLGVSWCELYAPPGSRIKYPKSYFDSVDNLVVDPDADRWEDVKWVARKCTHPVWQVEEEYGLPPGTIKGNYESYNSQGDTYGHPRETHSRKKYEQTFDLLCYWKIYSKAGFGARLKKKDEETVREPLDLEQFGDYCYLAVAEGIPFPLNMPSQAVNSEEPEQLAERAYWPIPFYTDGGWPFAKLDFYHDPNTVWPISLIKPAIGEIRFVNWCMSFLADKVAAGAKTLVGVMKAAAADIRKQIADQTGPFTLIELEQVLGKDKISELISFLEAPKFDVQIWTMVKEVLELIDKRTGLTELAYGMTGSSLRSAAEAEIKDQNLSVRPDHMANQVEDWISATCVKEMQAARWLLSGQDVMDVVGQANAHIWDSQILSQDVDRVVRDFDYRIEAGSARKPNKNNRIRSLNEFAQIAMAAIQGFAMEGMVDPWNALMGDLGKSLDLDPEAYLIRLPPPPPPDQQPPSPEEIQAQMDQQKLQMEQQKMQMQMQMEQEKAQLERERMQAELQMKQEEHQLKIAEMQAKIEFEKQKMQMELMQAQQKMQVDAAMGQQKIQLDQQQGQQKMALEQQQGQVKIETAKAQSESQIEATKAQTQAQKEQSKVATETTKQKAQVDMDVAKQKAAMQKQQAKQQAAQKPKPKGKP